MKNANYGLTPNSGNASLLTPETLSSALSRTRCIGAYNCAMPPVRSRSLAQRPRLIRCWTLMGPAPWPLVPPPYQTNSADIFITTNAPTGNAFFRLHKP